MTEELEGYKDEYYEVTCDYCNKKLGVYRSETYGWTLELCKQCYNKLPIRDKKPTSPDLSYLEYGDISKICQLIPVPKLQFNIPKKQ